MKLVVGKRYKVKLEDCCLKAYFTAMLVEIAPDQKFDWTTKWDNGVTIDDSMQADDSYVEVA